MSKEAIKTVVAGLGIASLVAGITFTTSTVQAASGWGGKQGAGSTQQEGSGSGWGGKTGAGSTKEIKPDKEQEKSKPAAEVEKPAEKPQQKPGASGWGASGWGGATGAGSTQHK